MAAAQRGAGNTSTDRRPSRGPMSTIGELDSFLARENAAATAGPPSPETPAVLPEQSAATNGKPLPAAK